MTKRIYLPKVVKAKQLKRNEQFTFELPQNAITQGITLTIRGDYTIGAAVPTVPNLGGIANIMKRLHVVDSRGTRYWNLRGMSVHTLFKKNAKGVEMSGTDIVASASSSGSFEYNIYLPFGQERSAFSRYDSGANTYTKKVKVEIDVADWTQDGVLFGENNDLAIVDSSVVIDITPESHAIGEGHAIMQNPQAFMMSTYIEKDLAVTATENALEVTLDKGRDFIGVNFLELDRLNTTAGNGIYQGLDGVLDDSFEVQLQEGDLSGRNLGKWLPRQLRAKTSEYTGEGSSRTAGRVFVPFADDSRYSQSKKSTTANPLSLFIPVVKSAVTNHVHYLPMIQEGVMTQEV